MSSLIDMALGTTYYSNCYGKHEKQNTYSKGELPVTGCDRMPTRVIVSGPATILFWSDGTKTVVKCRDNEVMDLEKGIALAMAKKALGNKGNYYNIIRKCLDMAEIHIEE